MVYFIVLFEKQSKQWWFSFLKTQNTHYNYVFFEIMNADTFLLEIIFGCTCSCRNHFVLIFFVCLLAITAVVIIQALIAVMVE